MTPEQLERAGAVVESSEGCNPNAKIPFDWLIQGVVG